MPTQQQEQPSPSTGSGWTQQIYNDLKSWNGQGTPPHFQEIVALLPDQNVQKCLDSAHGRSAKGAGAGSQGGTHQMG